MRAFDRFVVAAPAPSVLDTVVVTRSKTAGSVINP